MADLISPGIQVRELDLTNTIPGTGSSVGAIVGDFHWGPVDQIVQITSEKELVKWFGGPTSSKYTEFFLASQFLRQSADLRVSRAGYVNTDAGADITITDDQDANYVGIANATGSFDGLASAPQVILNDFEAQNALMTSPSSGIEIAAKYPGVKGNGIEVYVLDWNNYNVETGVNDGDASMTADMKATYAAYAALFQAAPRWNEIHVVVVDGKGEFTGTAGTVLETYEFLSVEKGTQKPDGTNVYYRDVINAQSDYILWLEESETVTADANNTNQYAGQQYDTTDDATKVVINNTDSPDVISNIDAIARVVTLGGTSATEGRDAVQTEDNIAASYATVFSDTETLEIDLLIAGGFSATNANAVIAVAEDRKDCIAFVSPPTDETVGEDATTATANVVAWAAGISSSSYAAIDSAAVSIYDRYNDQYRWIPASGSIAALCAFTDNVADPWWSPAGQARGRLLNVARLSYNPNNAQRDTLYKNRVNPLVAFPGEGIVLYGDKTALERSSAFDRINVRRLFAYIERAVAKAAKSTLFEFNDEFTRAQFRGMIEPYLRDIQGRRGITDFQVICDDSNNTAQVIDTNRFVADVYIKPARSINFITLNFIATRTGVEFSELVR